MGSGSKITTQQVFVDEDEADEGAEWISESNFGETIADFEKTTVVDTDVPSVGCITMDFAMQNVLLQIGLNLLSTGGKRVRHLRQWILKCDACLHEMKKMTRLFCENCGSEYVCKLAVSINDKGEMVRHYSRHRRIRTRGVKYSIPKPKGGRTGSILLREDQLLGGEWKYRAGAHKTKQSMFGLDVLDSLGLRVAEGTNITIGYGTHNVNSKKGRERRGAKKKKNKRR